LLDPTTYAIEDQQAGILAFVNPINTSGPNNIKVIYPGGFAVGSTALGLVEQAAIELIWLARDKGDQALIGLSSKSIGDSSIVVRNDWPAGAQAVLDMFRFRNL
jgi:hypothetical protein